MHIRRPQTQPEGGWRLIRCDCGWEGRTPEMGRTEDQIADSLDEAFRWHLPADQQRTYLLIDARDPSSVGVFVMPWGDPTLLLGHREEDGVHIGRYQLAAGGSAELPIGEIRSPGGRVFRLDE